MLRRGETLTSGETLHCDVAIAGAGAAGITVARDLDQSGLDVIALEAGGLRYDEAGQQFYLGRVSPPSYAAVDKSRLRLFGGTTGHWTGVCLPLAEHVFQARSWVRDSGWPIGPEDLAPHYRRARQTCELADPVEIGGVAARAGLPLLPLGDTGLRNSLRYFSPPTRFGARYRRRLAASRNVRVLLDTALTRVAASENGAAVESLRCRTPAGDEVSVRARFFVLALGGLENPRLLLASNDVTTGGLGNDRDLVGRYYMDHPFTSHSVYLASPLGPEAFRLYSERQRAPRSGHAEGELSATIDYALGIQRRERLLEGVLWPYREATLPPGASAGADRVRLRDLWGLLPRGEPQPRSLHRLLFLTEKEPNPESRVTLAPERDPHGVPRLALRYAVSELDRESQRRSLELAARAFGAAGIGRLWVDPNLHDDPFAIRGENHHMGTTRMHADPKRGVVDADCRVHGLANLYVAGSSVFPCSGVANPTLTLVALAHRLAAHLRSLGTR